MRTLLIRRVSLQKDADLLALPITGVHQAVAGLLSRRRNAWHSTMINRYNVDAPMYSVPRSGIQAAEKLRTRGTYFEIQQIPVLVFSLGRESIVVAEINSSTPFRSWSEPKSMAKHEGPFTGMDVVQAFGVANIGHRVSGWKIQGRTPSVIMGVVDTHALMHLVRGQDFGLLRSYMDAGDLEWEWHDGDQVKLSEFSAVLRKCARLFGVGKPTKLGRQRVSELADEIGVETQHVLQATKASIPFSRRTPDSFLSPEERWRILRWLRL